MTKIDCIPTFERGHLPQEKPNQKKRGELVYIKTTKHLILHRIRNLPTSSLPLMAQHPTTEAQKHSTSKSDTHR